MGFGGSASPLLIEAAGVRKRTDQPKARPRWLRR